MIVHVNVYVHVFTFCLVGHNRCKTWILSKCMPYNSAMPIRKVCETYCSSGVTVYICVMSCILQHTQDCWYHHYALCWTPHCPNEGVSLYMWSVVSSIGKRYMYTGCVEYSHPILHAFRFEFAHDFQQQIHCRRPEVGQLIWYMAW